MANDGASITAYQTGSCKPPIEIAGSACRATISDVDSDPA